MTNGGGLAAAALVVAVLCSACGGDDEALPDAGASADAAPSADADCSPAYTLYVNREGGTWTSGDNDAVAHVSSLLVDEVTLAAHDADAAEWGETMACLERIFAPYNVLVTDVEPGAEPRVEIAVSGDTSDAIGVAGGTTWVSPFSCDVLDNTPAFVFTGGITLNRGRLTCNYTAAAAAKLFGLDNVMGCPEVTTFFECSGQDREFLDEALDCGELDARDCVCSSGATTENHHQMMLERAGAAACP